MKQKPRKGSPPGEPPTPEQAEKDRQTVKLFLQPSVSAGVTLHTLRPTGHELPIDALVAELSAQATAVTEGKMGRMEGYLAAQVITLDGLFNSLTRRAMRNSEAGYLDAGETYMRLALKSQAQCRATVEALGNMKNPRPIAYVGQANIANGPQQVNNGAAPLAESQSENPQSKLLEAQHGSEWLDTRAAGKTGETDPGMEAVAAVDGAKDAGR